MTPRARLDRLAPLVVLAAVAALACGTRKSPTEPSDDARPDRDVHARPGGGLHAVLRPVGVPLRARAQARDGPERREGLRADRQRRGPSESTRPRIAPGDPDGVLPHLEGQGATRRSPEAGCPSAAHTCRRRARSSSSTGSGAGLRTTEVAMLKRRPSPPSPSSASPSRSPRQDPPADWDPGYGDRFLQTASPARQRQGALPGRSSRTGSTSR